MGVELSLIMTKTKGISFILMILALLGLFAVQAFWIFESISTHNKQINSSLKQSAFRIKQEIEEDFYCFRLQAQTDIMESDFLTITKSAEVGLTDTIRNYKLKNEDSTFIYPKHVFNYSIPVRLQVDLRFDYLIDSISEESLQNPEILAFAEEYREGSIVDSVNGLRVSYANSLKKIITKNLEPIELSSPICYALFHTASDRLIFAEGEIEKSEKVLQLSLYDDELKFSEPYTLRIYSRLPYLQVFISLGPFLLASFLIMTIGILIMLNGLRTWQKEKLISRFQQDMMHSITHEMNTPISNMQLAVQSLFGQLERGEVLSPRYLSIINQENKILAENMTMLMEYAQIEEGKVILNIKPLNVNEPLEQVVDSLRERILKLSGRIYLSMEQEPILIGADETHLINIFYNLLDNALKYCIETPIIEVEVFEKQKRVFIRFNDNNEVIPENQREKIFEKYYRISDPNKKQLKGYGLGLYYVKIMTNKFRGKIQILKAANGGNIFELNFPIWKA